MKVRLSNAPGKILILVAWMIGILGIAPAQTTLAAPPAVTGVTFTVNSTLDQTDANTSDGNCASASGKCTLRAAIMQANQSGSPTVTIVLPAGIYKLTIAPTGADDEKTGDLNLIPPIINGTSVIIQGAGAAKAIIDGNQSDRVLSIDAGRTVNISGVTIRNGKVPSSSGGGIYNKGALTLANSIVTANSAHDGGGIYNAGGATLAIVSSTISNNSATNNGGGINDWSGTVTITKSTISGNSASYAGGGIISGGDLTIRSSTINNNSAADVGGGIVAQGTSMNIINSTLTGNTSYMDGGGIWAYSGANGLYNATVTSNDSDPAAENGGSGGGIYVYRGATFFLYNSLVAGNYAQSANYQDCAGTLVTVGYNLFWNVTGCTINGTWGTLNSLSTIGPLQNNGGPTQTRALLPGSNAIDQGDNCIGPDSLLLVTDQRGVARIAGAKCDVGAYEYVPPYLSQATQDGWVLEAGENSNAGGTLNSNSSTLLIGDNAVRKQYRGILSFNTASLPDTAVITKVTLKLRKQGISGGGNPVSLLQGFMVDIHKGTFGTATLQLTDWQSTANMTLGPFKPALTGGWYIIDLTSAKAYINKLTTNSGLTQIRLRFKLDDNNDSVANYLSLYSGNGGAALRPQLIVEYYIP